MKCKYCDKVEIHWPENYQKGMKPLEEDTNIEHNLERCEELQHPTVKKGWIKRICELCDMETWFSRKHYTEITAVCGGCT